jgi:4,5-dihydroxyphthalate decarboxylase
MDRPKLAMALSLYDRHVPFFDGTITLREFDMDVLAVGESNILRNGLNRHHRMLAQQEFDACEVSLSSYIMAKCHGLPFTAIPVFPRRLFSHSHIWVNLDQSICGPKDLIGRNVGIITFQTTLSVQTRGDLQEEYGIPWREIKWNVASEEPIEFDLPKGITLKRIPKGKKLGQMLEDGEIDAVVTPRPPAGITESKSKIRRLFADCRREEIRYFHKHGFFPVMHVVALKEESVQKHPSFPAALTEAFKKAQEICQTYYTDPNWTTLAWARHLFEEERAVLGGDLWPIGLERNRRNLERFLGYLVEQGLLNETLPLEDLFVKDRSGL